MKKVVVLFFGVLLFLGVSCKQNEKKECCSKSDSSKVENKNEDLSDLNKESIYQLESDWQNQNGKPLKLTSFKGKIQVVAMVFTNCTYACPRIVGDMQLIESSLSEELKKQVDFILISFDVERDTPERLLSFSKEMKLSDNWVLLHGNEESTHEMSLVLGVKYDKQTDGSFAHSNIITVLNQDGAIAFQQEGLGVSQEKTMEAIKAIAK